MGRPTAFGGRSRSSPLLWVSTFTSGDNSGDTSTMGRPTAFGDGCSTAATMSALTKRMRLSCPELTSADCVEGLSRTSGANCGRLRSIIEISLRKYSYVFGNCFWCFHVRLPGHPGGHAMFVQFQHGGQPMLNEINSYKTGIQTHAQSADGKIAVGQQRSVARLNRDP